MRAKALRCALQETPTETGTLAAWRGRRIDPGVEGEERTAELGTQSRSPARWRAGAPPMPGPGTRPRVGADVAAGRGGGCPAGDRGRPPWRASRFPRLRSALVPPTTTARWYGGQAGHAEGGHPAPEECFEGRVVEQRAVLLGEGGLVGRPSALGHEQQPVLPAARDRRCRRRGGRPARGGWFPWAVRRTSKPGATWENRRLHRSYASRTPSTIAASSSAPTATPSPFRPITAAVPVSWQEGSTPSAEIAAFFKERCGDEPVVVGGGGIVEDPCPALEVGRSEEEVDVPEGLEGEPPEDRGVDAKQAGAFAGRGEMPVPSHQPEPRSAGPFGAVGKLASRSWASVTLRFLPRRVYPGLAIGVTAGCGLASADSR